MKTFRELAKSNINEELFTEAIGTKDFELTTKGLKSIKKVMKSTKGDYYISFPFFEERYKISNITNGEKKAEKIIDIMIKYGDYLKYMTKKTSKISITDKKQDIFTDRPGVGTDIYGNKSYDGVDYLTDTFVDRIEHYLKDAKESEIR